MYFSSVPKNVTCILTLQHIYSKASNIFILGFYSQMEQYILGMGISLSTFTQCCHYLYFAYLDKKDMTIKPCPLVLLVCFFVFAFKIYYL